MRDVKVGYLIGSLAKASINRKLAKALVRLAPTEMQLSEISFADLPLYSYDYDANFPPAARAFKAALAEAEAVLFVTPEYNRSVPGVLKNAIDLGSRPYGDSAFAGKPAAVIGASIGVIGTALAQQHLRNILAYLDMPVLGQPEAFLHFKEGLIDEHGTISNEGTKDFLQGFVDTFIAWVGTHGGTH